MYVLTYLCIIGYLEHSSPNNVYIAMFDVHTPYDKPGVHTPYHKPGVRLLYLK